MRISGRGFLLPFHAALLAFSSALTSTAHGMSTASNVALNDRPEGGGRLAEGARERFAALDQRACSCRIA